MAMEKSYENLVTENKKLHARVFVLEESKTSLKLSQVIDRLDKVIKVVNTQTADNYQLDQSVQDIQQELTMLRKTVDSWNDEGQTEGEEQQEFVPQEEAPDLPVYEDPGHLNGRDVILKQHNVLEVLKSAGALPKGEGPIVQVLDSIRRWEEQFLQVLRGLNLACSIYGKLLLNGVHSTLARLNKKKFAIEQIETKYKGSTLESQFYP